MLSTLFTSESVTEGHPDKVCDQIADAILDQYLKEDPHAHVACEVTAVMNKVHIMGEVTSTASVDCEATARQVIQKIGYTNPEMGFDDRNCKIEVDIHRQSPDIAMGVSKKDPAQNGAGDQGMMFGYACRETDSYMPLAIDLAHKLAKRLAYVRKMCVVPGLLPDGKTQVTVEYQDGVPVRVDTIVISTQHTEDIDLGSLKYALEDQVISHVIPEKYLDDKTKILINPTGRFVIGGPVGDSGLTGRKIIVDTYGGYARHGGGAFSGKDPSKVDRSGAYMARYLAKNIVACGYADRCEVQLGYAIGVAEPVSIHVETFGTGKKSEQELIAMIREKEDLTPAGIIERLKLCTPFYSKVSCYGHFGENASEMPWEQVTWKA